MSSYPASRTGLTCLDQLAVPFGGRRTGYAAWSNQAVAAALTGAIAVASMTDC
jgi:hypothetical protein